MDDRSLAREHLDSRPDGFEAQHGAPTESGGNDDEPFPEFEEEYNTVREINDQMIKARNEWEPPERPSYADEDASAAYYTGIVRSIRVESKQRGGSFQITSSGTLEETGQDAYEFTLRGEHEIEFGLDTGEADLTWVSITNTGERLLDNPYIKLCHMYDVNPESIQEFYTKELEVQAERGYDTLFTEPHHQPFKGLWNALYMPHYRYHLWNRKQKKSLSGLIPTWRFFLAYAGVGGTLSISETILNGVSALPTTLLNLVFMVLWGLWGVVLLWGTYAKLRYDGLPYVANWLRYAWEIHSHRNA